MIKPADKQEIQRTRHVDLWYPGTGGERSVEAVEVTLCHVRSAAPVRLRFDLAANEWVVESQMDYDLDDTVQDDPAVDGDALLWFEVARFPAWLPNPIQRGTP